VGDMLLAALVVKVQGNVTIRWWDYVRHVVPRASGWWPSVNMLVRLVCIGPSRHCQFEWW
jgi:hypothetical protein